MWLGLVEAAAGSAPASPITCTTAGCLDADGSCRIELRLKDAA
jgi:hypothetical protein